MIASHIFCVGGSTGGIEALKELLSDLPFDLAVPIVATLHRHRKSQDVLMRLLRSEKMPAVLEPYDKDQLSLGAVYVAPPNYHMLVSRDCIHLSVDDAIRHARPSIDVLFKSAAIAFGARSICTVLSGTNDDGVQGAYAIKKAGGEVLVQDPATALAPEMPTAVLNAVPDVRCMSIAEIRAHLVGRFAHVGIQG